MDEIVARLVSVRLGSIGGDANDVVTVEGEEPEPVRHAVPVRRSCRCAPVGPVAAPSLPATTVSDLEVEVTRRLGRSIDALTGLLTPPKVVAGGDGSAWVATSEFADPTHGGHRLVGLRRFGSRRLVRTQHPTRTGFGAGCTAPDARAKALLEVMERAASAQPVPRDSVVATALELGTAAHWVGRDGIGPASRWKSGGADAEDEEARLPIPWLPARDGDGGEHFVPVAHCLRGPCIDGAWSPLYEPSGIAVGLDLESATRAALFEVVERDAAAVWWFGRAARPGFALADALDDGSLEGDVARLTQDHLRRGRRVWCVDLTTSILIPVLLCVVEHDGAPAAFGLGCAATRPDALRRALLEAGQAVALADSAPPSDALVTHWPGARPGTPSADAPRWRDLVPRDAALRTASGGPDLPRHEVLVIDLSDPRCALVVVRVVVPGLTGVHAPVAPRIREEAACSPDGSVGVIDVSVPFPL